MSFIRQVVVISVLAVGTTPAAAQSVTLEFRNGLVTLRAENAPVRTILAEWARLGGTNIVNGERVPGAPLTLELNGVPERQAIDIILRTAGGYMIGARSVAAPGQSAFDRILILPTSNAPVNPPPPVQAGATTRPPIVTTFQPPVSAPAPFDPNNPNENPPGDVDPRLRGPVDFVPPRANAPTVAPQPLPIQIQNGQPVPPPVPVPAPQAPTSTNPFGVAPGSSRPGVINPVPPPQPQNARPLGDPEP